MSKHLQQLLRGFSWRHVRWVMPFAAALIPIFLLSIYADRTASRSVRHLIEAQNTAVTGNLSQLVSREMAKTLTLAEAFSSVPGTVAAVQTHDEFVLRTRLKALVVAYPQLSRAFIADPGDVLWAEYPTSSPKGTLSGSGSYGIRIADTQWSRRVRDGRQAVTPVYDNALHDRVVAIASPVRSLTGGHLATIVLEYNVSNVVNWLKQIDVPDAGELFLIDHAGAVVAHPLLRVSDPLIHEYAELPAVQAALRGKPLTTRYRDPRSATMMIASFQPVEVGDEAWVVVAQQPVVIAEQELTRVHQNIVYGGAALTLITLGMVIALARASAKIAEKNKKLMEADQMKDDFISFVSHQLKAPVTSISLGVESLLKGQLGRIPEKAQVVLRQMRQISEQDFKLITDLLNTSRINRGVIEAELADVDLKDILLRAVRDYRVPVEKAGLALILKGTDSAIRVHADLEKMGEAVSNAISNAIKYTPSGSITVSMYERDGFGCIDVTDTGQGMSPETLKKLFTRDQIFGASAHAEHSAGLGLYIAKNFMTIQGGDVSVRSERGKGTTMTFRVPQVLAKGSA